MKYLTISGLSRFLNNLKKLIPSKTSQLTNDSGYITADQVSNVTGYSKTEVDYLINQADSNAVHLTGNETIGGTKTFTSFPTLYYGAGDNYLSFLKSSSLVFGTAPQNTQTYSIRCLDKNDIIISEFSSQAQANGINNLSLRVRNTDGTNIYDRRINFNINTSGLTYFAPNIDNICSLGVADHQWKSVYANSYYLGSTAFGDIVTHNASEFLTSHQSLSNYSTKANTVKSLSISGTTITVTPGSGSTYTLTTQDTVYTHPTSAGNKHIPSGGSSGQFLGWDSDGTAKWVNNPNTNTDTLMTQNVSTTNATYPVLLVATADATANQGAKTGIFAKSVKVNPSTNVISASGFSGPLTGNVTGNVTGNCSGTSANVTGTVAIANGGTGATTRLNAVKALTNENVGTNATYFITITDSWGKAGYTSVANAKTVLGLGSAAYTASTDYATSSHTHSYLPLSGGTLTGNVKYKRSDATRGTAPSSNVTIQHCDVIDSANNRFALIETTYYTDKSSKIALFAYKTTAATGSNIGSIGIGCTSSGTVYTFAPTPAASDNSTQIATTAWVNGKGYLTSHQSLSNYSTKANTVKSLSISGKTITVTPGSGDAYTLTTQDTTYSNFVKSGSGAKAGLVPSPGTTAGTTKYLREDGTWQVPPDHTYTVNNATLTIQKNGSNVATFTSNASSNVTANITVPTKTSELTNDSGFLTSHQSLANYLTKTTNVSEMGRYIDMHYDNATAAYDYDARLYVTSQGTAKGGGALAIAAASVTAPNLTVTNNSANGIKFGSYTLYVG